MSSRGCGGLERLQDQAVTRVAVLLAENRVPPIDGCPLPSALSNAILEALRRLKLARPDTIARLHSNKFRLTEVNLWKCECDERALRTLAEHALESLSLYRATNSAGDDPRILLHRVADSLPPDARILRSLRSLNIGGCSSTRPFSHLPIINCFPCLESLFVSETLSLGNSELLSISHFHVGLRHLDISNTPSLTNISCLRSLRNLEVLLMHGIRLDMEAAEVAETFRALRQIKVIDLSDKRSDYLTDSSDERPRVDLGLVLLDALDADGGTPFWPQLRSLDLAGNPLGGLALDLLSTRLQNLVEAHRELASLSLLDTPLDRFSFNEQNGRILKVANGATRKQALQALTLYWRPERDAFAAHSLQAVYYLLQSSYDSFSDEEVVECGDLVEKAMRLHPSDLPVQMAGSACLYQLCKLRRMQRLDASLVRLAVDRCLDAAEAFPTMTQLQKNVWLTICNDQLLQMPQIDFYRTCTVALESMLSNRDPSVCRMTIAIVSIVAAKVSANDSHLLASDSRYVVFLLGTIRQQLALRVAGQFTLKFTLSALWNLTDECPVTCSQLVENGGVPLVFSVLSQYAHQSNICTKVLGLLNNLAEVESLHSHLCHNEYIEQLLSVMSSEPARDFPEGSLRIDVQYFSAGILSHLLNSLHSWNDCHFQKEDVNNRIIETVMSWPLLEYTMVAYRLPCLRSFTPFRGLLARDGWTGSQLWALWAIQHVTLGVSGDVDYLRKLREQGGLALLSDILSRDSTLPLGKAIADRILTASPIRSSP